MEQPNKSLELTGETRIESRRERDNRDAAELMRARSSTLC